MSPISVLFLARPRLVPLVVRHGRHPVDRLDRPKSRRTLCIGRSTSCRETAAPSRARTTITPGCRCGTLLNLPRAHWPP